MGGSSGGGGPFVSRTPEELAKLVRKAEDATATAAFEGELATFFSELLSNFNGRDARLVDSRLEDIKGVLKGDLTGTIDHRFGGSVAKHTYVDGLSDIDSLLLLDATEFANQSPRSVLRHIERQLEKKLEDAEAVDRSRLAVTVDFGDGMIIQLLPALARGKGRFRIPSSDGDAWSDIDPQEFTRTLISRNQVCGGKLVPTIKLAKAINATLPEDQRLTGYHLESLAIAAFGKYEGPKTTTAMLPAFFERAKNLVLLPIRDRTGQSMHVDEYLGEKGSAARQSMSHILERLHKRMRNATLAESKGQWRLLFGLDE